MQWGHVSSIVGQRLYNGVLHLLVRNSWGKGSCEKNRGEILKAPFVCDNGDYLVEAKKLMHVVDTISHIEP